MLNVINIALPLTISLFAIESIPSIAPAIEINMTHRPHTLFMDSCCFSFNNFPQKQPIIPPITIPTTLTKVPSPTMYSPPFPLIIIEKGGNYVKKPIPFS